MSMRPIISQAAAFPTHVLMASIVWRSRSTVMRSASSEASTMQSTIRI